MTNNKQQTAVEWYIDELEKYEKGTSEYFSIPAIQNHARRMEKEKTIKFTEDWYFNGPLLGEGIDVKSTIEQHFNNTYGGGEQ